MASSFPSYRQFWRSFYTNVNFYNGSFTFSFANLYEKKKKKGISFNN